MMQLYWSPRSRSFTALWLMEETGQPYQRVLTDISTGAQKKPEYLAINPMGKVPALEGWRRDLGGSRRHLRLCRRALSGRETRATRRRSPAREIPLLAVFRAGLHRTRDGADRDQAGDEFSRGRLGRSEPRVRRLDNALARGPWILGETFSAADIAIGSALNFAVRLFKMVPSRPSFDAYVARCMARPAFQRAEKIAAGASRYRSSNLPAAASK